MSLVSNAQALLDLDRDGALVPHGIGGHARSIISAFIEENDRLSAQVKDLTEALRPFAEAFDATTTERYTPVLTIHLAKASSVRESIENSKQP